MSFVKACPREFCTKMELNPSSKWETVKFNFPFQVPEGRTLHSSAFKGGDLLPPGQVQDPCLQRRLDCRPLSCVCYARRGKSDREKFSKHWGSDCQKATCCFAHSEKDRNDETLLCEFCKCEICVDRSRSCAAKLQPGILFTLLEVHDLDNLWTSWLYANAPPQFLRVGRTCGKIKLTNNKSWNRHTTILSSSDALGWHAIFCDVYI